MFKPNSWQRFDVDGSLLVRKGPMRRGLAGVRALPHLTADIS